MIGKTISHYKIIEKLGEGGMGVVYKAHDTQLNRTVALKFLPPALSADKEARTRFIKEAKAASALDHPNICNIHEIGETPGEPGDGQMFIVMACYEGETLKTKIKDEGLSGSGMKTGLKIKEVIDIAVQVSRGLAKAHEKGIVHRDIKPANIFITHDGLVKIVDFGLAKLSGQARLTQTGTTTGTPAYMSPEQTRGGEVDHRSDIWSLGVVMYEMLTGQLPFRGDYDQAVIYSILNDPPESLCEVPPELEKIILKALQKDPADRYNNMDRLIDNLEFFQKKDAKPEKINDKSTHQSFSKKWIGASIISLMILIGLVTLWLSSPSLFTFSEKEKISELHRIVVLPFENLGVADEDYFAEGITDEITSRLAAIHSLAVISRKSAFHYAKTDKSLREIGQELEVQYVLEGSVRWGRTRSDAERVRITPRLIRVSDDTQVWSESYDRVVDDIFSIQFEIAQNVIHHLDLILQESELQNVHAHYTRSIPAYQAYLRGRYFTSKPHFSQEDWNQAIENFRKATELDPDFALAWANLAKAHARLYYLREDLSEKRLSLAGQAAKRALELEPKSPDVHLALGYYYIWAFRDHQQALAHLSIAEKNYPNDVDILKAKASIFEPQGKWQQYISTLDHAMELSPKDASIPANLALGYWVTRDYARAVDCCNQSIELAPNEPWPYLYKAFTIWSWVGANEESRAALSGVSPQHEFYHWAWFWQEAGEGKYQDALKILARAPGEWIRNKMWAAPKSLYQASIYDYLNDTRLAQQSYRKAKDLLDIEITTNPGDPRYHSSLGIAYAGLGNKTAAIREGKKAVELLPLSRDAAYGISYAQDLSVIYVMVEEDAAAIQQIETLLSIPSWISPTWVKSVDFRYNPLKNNPDFKKMMKKSERK